MSIIRIQKDSNYSVISNVHLQDESLSWKAKGLLSYLLSKPDSWQVYISHLKNQSTDGRDATASGIRELIEAGYITRDYTRNEAGQIIGRDYIVYESSFGKKASEKPVNRADNPKTDNPSPDNPSPDNPSLLNTDYIKDGLKKNTDDVQEPPPSFSEDQLITILAGLMALIPEQHKKPSVKSTIEKALNAHSEDYVRLAILYTIAKSNGETWQKFKAFLGKCIDGGWADGWQPDLDQVDDEQRKAKFLESRRRMPDDILRADADRGCAVSAQVLMERGVMDVDNI